jgi:hypothetical protein
MDYYAGIDVMVCFLRAALLRHDGMLADCVDDAVDAEKPPDTPLRNCSRFDGYRNQVFHPIRGRRCSV